MNDLDSTMRDHADRWWAVQTEPPDLEAALDRVTVVRRSRALPVAAVAAVVVAASVVVAVVLGRSDGHPPRVAAQSAVSRPNNGGPPVANPPKAGGPPAGEGAVAGRLLQIGGPPLPNGETPRHSLAGLISVYSNRKGTGRPVEQTKAGRDGRFTVVLAPGVYYVRGASSSYVLDPPPGIPPCSAAGAVRIAAGRTVHVQVVCAVP